MRMSQTANVSRLLLLAAALLLTASYATAGIINQFSGSDDGASTSGPWPVSTATQAMFLASAGPTSTLTFESLALGYYTPIAAAPGVTITLNATNDGCAYSGICNSTYGNLYGFNVTPGGSQWLGAPIGTTTYSFATPITAFGLWLTGVQTVFTTSFTLTFNDGTAQTLNLPINVNGGASYYGFTDSASFSSITITNLSDDAWGQDDVSYSSQSTVPEPGSLMMFGSGVIGLAGLLRRRLNV
jgi:PEP-CTERM motif